MTTSRRATTGRSRGLASDLALVAVALGVAALRQSAGTRADPADLRGQVALITGASRGLGLLLAREFARAGCRLVICAREQDELEEARVELERQGVAVLAVPCDVGDPAQVDQLVAAATDHYGGVDILVNNAGIIQVGPAATMTLADYEEAMRVNFWGTVHTTLALLPQMRARGAGRIVNITSIGGAVSVPHLLPYSSAKFAAKGFSEGLRAELAREGITVTTIVPGLMRTGSPLNAGFKGRSVAEFAWFAVGDSLPLLSMDAEAAARAIVLAARHGEAERVLTLPAMVLARLHGLAPGLMADLLGVVNRFLPAAEAGERGSLRGASALEQIGLPLLRALIRPTLTAARRFNQEEAADGHHQPAAAGDPGARAADSRL